MALPCALLQPRRATHRPRFASTWSQRRSAPRSQTPRWRASVPKCTKPSLQPEAGRSAARRCNGLPSIPRVEAAAPQPKLLPVLRRHESESLRARRGRVAERGPRGGAPAHCRGSQSARGYVGGSEFAHGRRLRPCGGSPSARPHGPYPDVRSIGSRADGAPHPRPDRALPELSRTRSSPGPCVSMRFGRQHVRRRSR